MSPRIPSPILDLRRALPGLAAGVAVLGLAACQPADEPRADAAADTTAAGAERTAGGEAASQGSAAAGTDGAIEIVGRDYAFEGPAEIPSGWTTFRFVNRGQEVHFFLLNRLPEGRTFEQYMREVAVPFDSVWGQLRTGAMDKAEAGALLGRLLPAWYADVAQMGGVGLVAPGRAATASAKLLPGTYVMECYVKTREGEFHASLGMARPITVTADSTGASPPEADLEITLTNRSLTVEGEPTPGTHTVAVHFTEHPEVGLGNDVHLVRLDEGQSLEDIVPWMDWMNVDGLRAPAPTWFLGGTQEVPAGETAYFTVDLAPGRYGWISESTAQRGVLEEFTVE